VRSGGEALRNVVELLERGGAPGWTYVPADQACEPSGPVSPWPLVDSEGEVLGVVRRDDSPPCASDDVVVALLQCAVGLVAIERRHRRMAARASRAEEESVRDALTGLPNRRSWERELAAGEGRCDGRTTVATIAVIDLDQLKHVNDTHGHLAGDVLLRTAAHALQSTIRHGDRVARLGGDEFGVLLISDDGGHPDALRERLAEALHEHGVFASVGVACQEPGAGLLETFEAADEAMYAAKARSRRARC
jgi:diguanylate cyclase (GGDEF)-like protein